jgi:hypothetical protein
VIGGRDGRAFLSFPVPFSFHYAVSFLFLSFLFFSSPSIHSVLYVDDSPTGRLLFVICISGMAFFKIWDLRFGVFSSSCHLGQLPSWQDLFSCVSTGLVGWLPSISFSVSSHHLLYLFSGASKPLLSRSVRLLGPVLSARFCKHCSFFGLLVGQCARWSMEQASKQQVFHMLAS